ncbi:MAG: ATP:cob(I)alamin adenosyltransferase [Actinobacteria bacterium HGW-Actinobacteria-7]|nr:MAG: ATP:cob(I)alamin adenosyltransferase [Actinobacteria bacterium HGW-Actinobacteria-7]
MTIYTRRGDHGQTSLADGTRVSKTAARVEAYGAVDEANSAIGFARAALDDPYLDEILHFVQQRLFNCSSSLAFPGASEPAPTIDPEDVAFLERAIDACQARTGELTQFLLEAGAESACRLHVARAIMRRAERRIYSLDAEEPVAKQVLAFINRSSDLLFAAARYCNATEDVPEETWDRDAARPAL